MGLSISSFGISGSHYASYILAFLCTARSREDETRNGHRNANQNSRWSFQVSFRTAHLKRAMSFDYRGFRFAFRRAFRVSSSRERAVSHVVHVFLNAYYTLAFLCLTQNASCILASLCLTRSSCVLECILHIGFLCITQNGCVVECIAHIGFSTYHT